MTAHKPAPAHAPSAAPSSAQAAPTAPSVTSATPAQASVPATAADAPAAVVPAKPQLGFPIALTIAAILPLAWGLGTLRLKASISPVGPPPTVSVHDWDREELIKSQRDHNRELGDRKFLERRFEVALNYYRSLGSSQSERMPPEILYRIGLCEEELGLWDEALESFRNVSAATENQVLKSAASFAQARIHLRLDQPNPAVTLLRSLAVPTESQKLLPQDLSKEIAVLFPLALAQETVSPGNYDGQSVSVPVSRLMTWSVESELAWANESLQPERLQSDALRPSNLLICRVKRPSSDAANPLGVESWTADVGSSGQSVQTIIARLGDECGWTIDWSDVPVDQPLSRTLEINADNRPVCWLLTLFCSEIRATWSLEQNQLKIKRCDRPDDVARVMADRTLGSLVNWTPDQRLIHHVRFVQAQIAHSQGRLPKSAQIYSSLVGRDSSLLSIHSAYCAAEDFFRIGEFNQACQQLRYVVDGAPEHELHTESLIMLGRMLLDLGETEDAIFQFRRATEVRGRPADQARAAVLLGMAYLTQERYQDAAEAVFAHKFQFDQVPVRHAASFVTAFARWKSVNRELREREAAFLYRSLIALRSNVEWLGQTGHLLIGRAYAELGFEDQMSDIYLKSLAQGVTKQIESEMSLVLAKEAYANGEAESAKQIWQKLADQSSNRCKDRARARLADAALNEGRAKDCLNYCELIEVGQGVSRAEVQKLMGRAFEALGENVLAAKCYAGQLPKR